MLSKARPILAAFTADPSKMSRKFTSGARFL
jgi:hypothetical protein